MIVMAAGTQVLGGCSQGPQDPPPPLASIGAWGFDLAGMDTGVRPGEDFYRYANGTWLANNEIPADQTTWGAFGQLTLRTEEQVHALLEALPESAPAGSTQQKVRDYYRAFLDVEHIEAAGLAPARAGLETIAAADTYADVARLMGRADLGLNSPIYVGVTLDQKNPDRYIAVVTQSGLGLPEREYYLKDDPALVEIRSRYRAHIARMFELAGIPGGDAKAQAILALETQIAQAHWPAAKRRERDLTYNLRSAEALRGMGEPYPWTHMLEAAGLQQQSEFVVRELDAVESLAKWFTSVPVEQWRDYLTYHYLRAHASVLPRALDEENFDFYGRTLSGQPQQRERWKRAVAAVNRALGEEVGKLYVAQHFPPESKAKMTELVDNLRRAYAQRIRNVPWMSEETKALALEKLAAFRPKIGYPDQWRDYSGLEVRAGDAFGNLVRSRVFEWQDDLDRLSKPADRDRWFMSPQTVNAYYNSTFNEIVFPAAILQPPFFDPHADDAVNYGAIGGVIGHEMGHGFDDQGAKSDARGVLRTWWQPQDEEAFRKLVDALVEQYGKYEALPGLYLNGRLTAGENIGDLGGLTVAYEAYRMSLAGQAPATIDGFTGDQRFFLSWAQVWRELKREETLRTQVMSRPHSPAPFRVNGVVRNIDAWYEAFDVQPGDALYLPPEQRVRIW
ncbi:MAG: peptidase M13 [Proteobacteria bacterium]|nr:MAG: peptidase M13 [Pseudomonadota bacterium]